MGCWHSPGRGGPSSELRHAFDRARRLIDDAPDDLGGRKDLLDAANALPRRHASPLEIHSFTAENQRVVVETDLADGIPPVTANSQELEQVFLNLFVNALQAMPSGGLLKVSSTNFENKIHIQVSDNGPGVALENRERIFNPFVTTRDSGTGLGLAITQRIVQGHGGHIVLYSTPGQGANFTICLPLSLEKTEAVTS